MSDEHDFGLILEEVREINKRYRKCVDFIKSQVVNHYCCKCTRINSLNLEVIAFLRSLDE